MRDETDIAALTALLAWQRDMGADAAVSEEAVDWLERGPRPPGHAFELPVTGSSAPALSTAPPQGQSPPGQSPPAQSPPAPTPHRGPAAAHAPRPNPKPSGETPPRASTSPAAPRQFASTPPDAAQTSARNAARSARSLTEIESLLAAFDGCGLKATAKSLCFKRGADTSPIMLIGEAPGRDEDIAGRPFVGPAGRLLDKMLASIGLDEAGVHITNIVYWRPPGNRTPTPQEAQVCRPFLERQTELVAPKIIVALGGAAAKHLFGVEDGIMRIRGQWRDITLGAHRAKAIATLHPAYLLRTPAAKRLAWRDLLAIKAALAGRA